MLDTVAEQLAYELAYTSALLQAAYCRLACYEGVNYPATPADTPASTAEPS